MFDSWTSPPGADAPAWAGADLGGDLGADLGAEPGADLGAGSGAAFDSCAAAGAGSGGWMPMSEVLAMLLAAVPGVSVMSSLLSLDRSGLDEVQAVTFLQVLERQLSWCHGVQAQLLVLAAGGQRFVEEYCWQSPQEREIARAYDEGTPVRSVDDTGRPVDAEDGSNGGVVLSGVDLLDAALLADSVEVSRVQISDAARDEIAAALRWSKGYTQERIDQARLLAGPLTATASALSHG